MHNVQFIILHYFPNSALNSGLTHQQPDNPPSVGASIARPQSASFKKEGDRVSGGGFSLLTPLNSCLTHSSYFNKAKHHF